MTPKRVSWTDKYRLWTKAGNERFARSLLEEPERTTLAREIPAQGVLVLMGDIRAGKTGLAFKIMDFLHERQDMPGCLFLPFNLEKRKSKLLPRWVSLCTSLDRLPKRACIVVDEAAQTAHARRAMSGTAVSLDNLTSLAGQREQLIIYIAHFSRKLDPNLITMAHRVIWKEPTQAHAIFERDEMQVFTRRAIEVFEGIRGPQRDPNVRPLRVLRASYVMDFRHLRFAVMNNDLPSWWHDELSRLFENHRTAMPASALCAARKSTGKDKEVRVNSK